MLREVSLFTRATSQSPCLHETLAIARDSYEKFAERVSHSIRLFMQEIR